MNAKELNTGNGGVGIGVGSNVSEGRKHKSILKEVFFYCYFTLITTVFFIPVFKLIVSCYRGDYLSCTISC